MGMLIKGFSKGVRHWALHIMDGMLLLFVLILATLYSIVYLWLFFWLTSSDACSAVFGILFLASIFSYIAAVWVSKFQNRQMRVLILIVIILFFGEAFFVKMKETNPLPRFLDQSQGNCFIVCKENQKLSFIRVDEEI